MEQRSRGSRNQDSGVGLAQAIELIRSELEQAGNAGRESQIAFTPESVELEFEVIFDETVSADAGVRVWVVSLGSTGERSRGRTQRLKVTLTPVARATGRSPQIADEGEH